MNVAIVVAAGKGTRLGGDRPKQFLELDGIPVIIRTLIQFERCREISELVIVLPQDETDGFLSLLKEFGLQKLMRATVEDLDEVEGVGETRAKAIKEGLSRLAETSILDRYN